MFVCLSSFYASAEPSLRAASSFPPWPLTNAHVDDQSRSQDLVRMQTNEKRSLGAGGRTAEHPSTKKRRSLSEGKVWGNPLCVCDSN